METTNSAAAFRLRVHWYPWEWKSAERGPNDSTSKVVYQSMKKTHEESQTELLRSFAAFFLYQWSHTLVFGCRYSIWVGNLLTKIPSLSFRKSKYCVGWLIFFGALTQLLGKLSMEFRIRSLSTGNKSRVRDIVQLILHRMSFPVLTLCLLWWQQFKVCKLNLSHLWPCPVLVTWTLVHAGIVAAI